MSAYSNEDRAQFAKAMNTIADIATKVASIAAAAKDPANEQRFARMSDQYRKHAAYWDPKKRAESRIEALKQKIAAAEAEIKNAS